MEYQFVVLKIRNKNYQALNINHFKWQTVQKVKLPLILGLEGHTFARSLRNQTLSAMGGSTQSLAQISITGSSLTSVSVLVGLTVTNSI